MAHQPNASNNELSEAGLDWVKSSYSSWNGDCVELATAGGTVLLRDSKDLSGPVIRLGLQSVDDFIQAIREGQVEPVDRP